MLRRSVIKLQIQIAQLIQHRIVGHKFHSCGRSLMIYHFKSLVLVRKGRAFYATLYQEVFFANPGGGGSLSTVFLALFKNIKKAVECRTVFCRTNPEQEQIVMRQT